MWVSVSCVVFLNSFCFSSFTHRRDFMMKISSISLLDETSPRRPFARRHTSLSHIQSPRTSTVTTSSTGNAGGSGGNGRSDSFSDDDDTARPPPRSLGRSTHAIARPGPAGAAAPFGRRPAGTEGDGRGGRFPGGREGDGGGDSVGSRRDAGGPRSSRLLDSKSGRTFQGRRGPFS